MHMYVYIWRRRWQPTPVLLPGKSHGRRSLVGCSPWDRWGLDTTEQLHFHFSLWCIGEGNGNPLQCPCLENPRDGGAWWAAVYGVAQNQTRLKRLGSSSSMCIYMYIYMCVYKYIYVYVHVCMSICMCVCVCVCVCVYIYTYTFSILVASNFKSQNLLLATSNECCWRRWQGGKFEALSEDPVSPSSYWRCDLCHDAFLLRAQVSHL